MKKQQVCVIVGPTASGKTALSIQIAKAYGGEIINGDAMQVYRNMDIGTAKITTEEMEGVQHHLFSIVDPSDEYSIYEYQHNVRQKIEEISNRNKLPIIVGGSGLYIQSVLYDYQLGAQTIKIKDDLSKSNEALWQELFLLDEVTAQQLHPNNRRRVFRALVRAQSGDKKSLTEAKEENQELLYDVFVIGIDVDREILSKRIEQRVDMMLEQGLEDEVSTLFQNEVSQTARVAIGYREWVPFFEKTVDKKEVRERIIIHTRQLAKKQRTWFKNQRLLVEWIKYPEDSTKIMRMLENWKTK